MDITDCVAYGSESILHVYIKRNGDWDGEHDDCDDHPTGTVTATVNIWKRDIPVAEE
jgi:hypothetical protein